MIDAITKYRRDSGLRVRKIMAVALFAAPCVHAVLLCVLKDAVPLSRVCTAAVAAIAAGCALWRASAIGRRFRSVWLWVSAGLFLWATAHLVEAVLGNSIAASNLAVDASDFFYVIAAFPLLMALSTTRETKSLRTVFYLNCMQVVLAFILTYDLLYRIPRSAGTAATVMGRIYAADCTLLAVMAAFRLFAWETLEERRSFRVICSFLWTYLPIELGMDYATRRWNLHSGSLLDLLWSVPFVVTGWMALKMPISRSNLQPRKTLLHGRLLVETLCPMMVTFGIFALAASVTTTHPWLGLSAIFVSLLVVGLQNGMLQLNYLTGQTRLLAQEHDLRIANAALEQLSHLDPLTSIANRRRFDAALMEAWRAAERKELPVALLIVDIDFFKGANDLHGHSYGDQCIVTIAKLLDAQAGRPHDLIARYGGDEFLLLLPETYVSGAETVAERIHQTVRGLCLENRASPFENRLTVSIGVGLIDADLETSPDQLLERADRALYEAKRLGRNRTCIQRSDAGCDFALEIEGRQVSPVAY